MGIGFYVRGFSIFGLYIFIRLFEFDVLVIYKIKELEDSEFKIRLGDYIMGDVDGVVVILLEKMEECVELCELRWVVDEVIRDCFEKGEDIGLIIKKFRNR